MKSLETLIGRFSGKRILVVGDIMLDRFIWGNVSRISPEAPVPVVNVEREAVYPGGAANAARNLVPFAGEVHMMGRVGADRDGFTLKEILQKGGIDATGVQRTDCETITKTRIIASKQQVVRFDREKITRLCVRERMPREGKIHRKVPQAGIARIEDDVELGACSCVDRATLGETVVGRGTKIDNLVQIGHNVRIGPLCLIVAQVGVSGSTELGQGVILAGQVGVIGHLRIGDGARVGAQSGVGHDVADGETVSGSPAINHREWLRMSVALPRVADLLREVRRLQQRIEKLEKEKGK